LERRKSLGEHLSLGACSPAQLSNVVPASDSRYQGYTIHVPVMTVAQATTAIAAVPIFSLRNRSMMPASVTYSVRKLHSPARPPANASRKNVED